MYLGIDAGSTTTKLVVIGANGELLFDYYANNQGNPIKTATDAVCQLKQRISVNAKIFCGDEWLRMRCVGAMLVLSCNF